MAPTLEDILSLPLDVRQEHLAALGWAPPPPPAAPAPPGAVAGVTGTTPKPSAPQPIAPYDPSKPMSVRDVGVAAGPGHLREPVALTNAQLGEGATNAPKPIVMPGRQQIDANAQAIQGPTLAPGAVPGVESDALKPVPTTALPALNYREQQRLPLTSPGVVAGTSQETQNERDRILAQRANPYGSPENHGGWLGKLAHYAAKAGNIALDVVDPSAAAIIPGTDFNRQLQEARLAKRQGVEEERNTAKEAVEQRPEIAEATGELREQLQEGRDKAAEEREEKREANLVATTGMKTASTEKVAGGKEASTEKIAGQRVKSNEEMLRDRLASQERIATGHNLAQTEIARIRGAAANDPNKLTMQMKSMKQQAEVTLPRIDAALDETEKVANELGPTEGRWNDFWQGKVGAENKDFAHYKDEVAFVSTAVTLAHARGRMSNELFEHFQKMFDAGRQAPENMIQALDVAKEWLTDYANLGNPGTPTNPTPPANTPPANTPPAANAPAAPKRLSVADWKKQRNQQAPPAQ